MKKTITFLLAVSINILGFGQKNTECGTRPPNEKEVMNRKYVGNNTYLLNILKSHNINLPNDYFKNIDTKGLYKGRRLPLNEVKGKGLNKPSPDNISNQQNLAIGTIYYIPVHIWNHKNGNGYAAMSSTEMYDMLNETFEIYRKEAGNIEFYIKDLTYPNNSPYYNLANNENAVDDMFDDYFDPNAMNFHIVNNAPSAGLALNPGTVLYVSQQNRSFATISTRNRT